MAAGQTYRLGVLLVTVAVLAWSTAGLFTRAIALDAPTILFWRGVFGAAGTVAVMLAFPRLGAIGSFRQLGSAGWAYGATTATAMLFFVSALLHTSVAHVAFLTAAVPFVAGFLGWVILRERPGLGAILASLAAVFGVAIMVGFAPAGIVFGDGLAMAMAVCMAAMILFSRRFPGTPALAVTAIASGLSACAVLPFATLTGLSGGEVGLLVAFALVNQVLGFGFFILGARLLPPMETALIGALEAPLAPLWVWLVLSEAPGQASLLGGGIVFAALILHILRENAAARAAVQAE
jgi:drug/metabolite transporter (DMT)-like permease